MYYLLILLIHFFPLLFLIAWRLYAKSLGIISINSSTKHKSFSFQEEKGRRRRTLRYDMHLKIIIIIKYNITVVNE